MSNERYTVIVSGEKLMFTKDQIQSDPGNYFDTYFFGDFAEGAQGTRELLVEKDVQLFKLIQAHLRGYEIIPLADTAIPWYMTREGALANLLHEAQFYALDTLVAKIQHSQDEASTKTVKHVTNVQEYMFATRGTGSSWVAQNISEEIYRFHLSRFSNLQNVVLLGLRFSPVLGYTVQVAWMENWPWADRTPGQGGNTYALLTCST